MQTRDFTITAKIPLTPSTDADLIREQAEILRDNIDAVLLTDNQFGKVHMSTVAASVLLLRNGVDPIMQLSCRNKNRIALISDLLGAAALGITSLLLVQGNKLPKGFDPRPKAVHDVNATELIATALTMKTDEQFESNPDFFIGGNIAPHVPDPGSVPQKLIDKIDAGAQFVQTHVCMNMDLLSNFMKHLVENNLIRRVSFIAGTAVFPTAEAARWLKENRRNVMIPESIIKRLKQAKDPESEGIKICTEQMQEMAEIPGVSGVNVMSGGEASAIVAAVHAANLNS